MVMDGFVPTLEEGLMILFAIICGFIGAAIANYFGKKDEALIDYAEPFEERVEKRDVECE